MNNGEEMRKGDPFGIPICLLIVYFLGMLMSAMINTSMAGGTFVKIVIGLFIVLLVIFFIALLSGFVERICNQLFKLNDYSFNKEKYNEINRKIIKIESYCSWIPSIALFVCGWVFFKGDIIEFKGIFGAFGDYITTGWVVFILAFVLFVPKIIQMLPNVSVENEARFVIAHILLVIIGIGASVAVYNSLNRPEPTQVECGICHGSGIQPDYTFDCLFCDGKGYVIVDAEDGEGEICSSCGQRTDELITKADVGGDVVTWCNECWENYYDIIY